MKILHIIRSVDPKSGGPIEGVHQLAAAAIRKGHEIEIASLDIERDPWVKSSKVRVYPLGPAAGRYGFSSRFAPWLRKNSSRFDVVVVNGIWQYHSFGTWRALRNSQTPYAVFTHGMLDPWFKKQYPLKHAKKWLYWPWADYRVLRDAGAVLFTCEEERVLARQSFWLYKADEAVVNYGTAAPPDDQRAQQAEFFHRFPTLEGKRLVVFLGRIHRKKGCDLVIESFSDQLCQEQNWHLVMAGPDQDGLAGKLQQTATSLGVADRITWTGALGGLVKWGALRAAEVFVLPSHQENFGIAVAEALACGVPVLISNKVNIWREVQLEQAGLVAEDTARGLSGMLNRWKLMPKDEALLMRQRARGCFERRFEIGQASASILQKLERLAHDQRCKSTAHPTFRSAAAPAPTRREEIN